MMNMKNKQRGHFSFDDLYPIVAIIGAILTAAGGYLLYIAYLMWK